MTATLASELTRTPRDLRTASRRFAAVLMPIGPLAVAIVRYALPYDTNDSARTAVAKIAAHPGAERLAIWLTVPAVLTLVPGALAAIKLAARRAPVLSAVAALLVVPAYLSLFAVAVLDYVGITVTKGIGVGTVGRVAAAANGLPSINLLTAIFVVGHVLGTILLSVALYRSRRVGVAGCLILGVSQPLHLAAAVTGNHLVDLIGWLLTALGMAIAARAVLALSDDEWELPPVANG